VTCPRCGLALPAHARFCARCGTALRPGEPVPARRRAAPPPAAPAWLLALLWVGAAGLVVLAAVELIVALDVVPAEALGAGTDVSSVRGAAAVIAACAASLAVAHVAAAVGLMGGRTWARTFATMVCVVWALTCVGLPVGLLGITALWRPRRAAL